VTSYHSSVPVEKPERRFSCRKASIAVSHDKGVGEKAREGNIVGHLRGGGERRASLFGGGKRRDLKGGCGKEQGKEGQKRIGAAGGI